jgi:apolipoprotein N-acyltransferase
MENRSRTPELIRVARSLHALLALTLPPIAASLVALAVPVFAALGFALFVGITITLSCFAWATLAIGYRGRWGVVLGVILIVLGVVCAVGTGYAVYTINASR